MMQTVYWHAPLWEVLLFGGSALLVFVWLAGRALRRSNFSEILTDFNPEFDMQSLFLFDQVEGVTSLTQAAEQLLDTLSAPHEKKQFDILLDTLTEAFVEGRIVRVENWPEEPDTLTALPLAPSAEKTIGVLALITRETTPPPPEQPVDGTLTKAWAAIGTSLGVHRSRPMVRVFRDSGWQELPLKHNEEALLRYFLEQRGQTQTSETLFSALWPEEEVAQYGLQAAQKDRLRRLIFQLRQRIEPDPRKPHYVCTVHGVGYVFHGE
ncbi:MAG: helix-turn-helix domain-containing protein [Anaerolineales bacterium]